MLVYGATPIAPPNRLELGGTGRLCCRVAIFYIGTGESRDDGKVRHSDGL